MKAITVALSRITGTRIQTVITAFLLIVGITAGAVLLYNYFNLTRSIEQDFDPAVERLPQLVALRNSIAQLHAETETVFTSSVPEFSKVDNLRANLSDRLILLKSYTATSADYQKVFASVTELLQVYDANLEAFRANPDSITEPVRFGMQVAFRNTESDLDAVYQRQERIFINATAATLESVRSLQLGLIVVGVTILALGATLIFSIRRASQRESLLASGRLQMAAEIGQAAASVLSLDQLYDTTLNLIIQRFGYYYACIFLTDENGEYAVLRAATGEAGRNLIATGHKVLVGANSTIGQVTFSGQALMFSESRRQTEYFKNELIATTRSELAVPLRQGGQVIGALDIQALEADPFTNEDTTVLQTLADQIAVAIGNAAQFTHEQARARQMSTLSQASLRLAGPQVSLSVLLEAIVEEARALLGADDADLWLPIDNGELELKASVDQRDQLGQRLKRGEDVSGQAFETGATVRIDDYRRWTGSLRQQASTGIESALAVPLLWQAEAIGTLTLTRHQINRPFTADDQQIAQLYATQVASAIENNRLLQETQDRVSELFTLNQVGQAIAAQTDLKALFDILRQEIIRALNTKSFYIAFYDAPTHSIELPYSYEAGLIQSVPPSSLDRGFTSHIIQTRQPLRINNAAEANAYTPLVSDRPTQSYLGVPLLQRDQVLGVIAVQDLSTPNAYSEADVRLLTTIANQVSLSIQNIRLLAQTRRRAEELTSLNRITNAIISVRDLQELLADATREIVAIFNCRNCGIALIDASGQSATVVADANRDPNEFSARGVVIPLEGNASAQRVIETQQSLIIQNAQTDPLTTSIHGLMKERHTTGLMIVPLLVRGKVIGTLGLDTDEPNRVFSPPEQELAETLVAQIATAIDTHQLLEETSRRAEQLAAAAQISQAASSILDPDELIIRSANLIRERFNLYYVAIFLVDADNEWANLRYATGEAGQKLLAINHRLGIGSQSMVGAAIASRVARIALDVGQEAVRFNNPYLPDTHSEMALPLVVAGHAIGALDVQSTHYSAFNQDDITALQSLADQIAVALQNARQFERTQQRVKFEQFINQFTTKLRRAIDPDSIMSVAMSELQTILGARRIVAQLGPNSLPTSQPQTTAAMPSQPSAENPVPAKAAIGPAAGNGHRAGSNGHAKGAAP